jgi:hypothetical protein
LNPCCLAGIFVYFFCKIGYNIIIKIKNIIMPSSKLPKGGNDFRMSGVSGFSRSFSDLIRHGKFSNLKDNKAEVEKIFNSLIPTIRRNGKIPYTTRRQALLKFMKISGTTKQDERNLRELLDVYK